MLDKEVCRWCRKTVAGQSFPEDPLNERRNSDKRLAEWRASLVVDEEFENHWENWDVYCPVWMDWPAIKIFTAPPRGCPFVLDHVVATQDKDPHELFGDWARFNFERFGDDYNPELRRWG